MRGPVRIGGEGEVAHRALGEHQARPLRSTRGGGGGAVAATDEQGEETHSTSHAARSPRPASTPAWNPPKLPLLIPGVTSPAPASAAPPPPPAAAAPPRAPPS